MEKSWNFVFEFLWEPCLEKFCRHIPARSTTQAALNKECLFSICLGVSLKQPVTCVTISKTENVI